jgi:hypothetical protein
MSRDRRVDTIGFSRLSTSQAISLADIRRSFPTAIMMRTRASGRGQG